MPESIGYFTEVTSANVLEAHLEWVNRCRSEAVDKAVNDNGVLEVKVHDVADVWPRYRGNVTQYPINLFVALGRQIMPEKRSAPPCDERMVPGASVRLNGFYGAVWYNYRHAIILHCIPIVGRYTARANAGGYV